MRTDRAAAVVAVAMRGGKLDDNMPWPRDENSPEDVLNQPVASDQQIMMALGATVGSRKKKSDVKRVKPKSSKRGSSVKDRVSQKAAELIQQKQLANSKRKK